MSRLQRIRYRAMSLRGGIAVGGALAIAVSLTQVVGTLAAPDLERTATLPIASANYFPTPLPGDLSCETKYDGKEVNTGAIIKWSSAGAGMKYRVLILRDNDPNKMRVDTYIDSPSYRYVGGGTAQSDRVRIYTVNVASGTTDATRIHSSGFVSHTANVATHNSITRCSGDPRYDSPNQAWENSQNWSPGIATFRVPQPVVNDPRALAAETDGPEGALENDATLNDAAGENSATDAPTPKSAAATTSAASTSAPGPRSSTSASPAPTPAVKPTTSSSSSTSSTTTAPASSTTRASATTTSTTVPATASSVALPGGGEAELVGETTLVVSGEEGAVCTAKVREGSTLNVRSGVLEVTDAVETRVVDQETCELA